MGRSALGKSYRDLRVWNTAVSLVLEVYRITESLPQAERFGELGYLQPPSIKDALAYCESISRMITRLKRAL